MPLLGESQLQRLDYNIHNVGAHKHDDGKWCSGSSSMQCVQLSQLSLQETDNSMPHQELRKSLTCRIDQHRGANSSFFPSSS